LISKIEKYLLIAIVFLFPIFVIPISPNPFVVSRLAILSFGLILLLLVRSARILYSGKLEFSSGSFDFPIAIIALSYFLSALLKTPNKMEAILLPGTATIYISGALIYFFVNQLKNNDKEKIENALLYSGAVFSIVTLASFLGIFSKIGFLPSYLKSSQFTLDGGYTPAAIFLGTLLVIAVGKLLNEKDTGVLILKGISTLLIFSVFAICVYQILPGKPLSPRFPSLGTSWVVAIDSLKESPIFGIGPGNYLTAFNKFRPISYNSTDLWAIRFGSARNTYLTMFTEVGILGISAFIMLLIALYKTIKHDLKEKMLVGWGFSANTTLISLILLLIALSFFPVTHLSIFVLFLLLALNSTSRHTSLNLTTSSANATENVTSRLPALILTIPIIALSSFLLFKGYRIVYAEYKFQRALNMLSSGKPEELYKEMRAAIRINPFVDRYHAVFSRVNIAMANAIAEKSARQAKEKDAAISISNEDRQNITLLIQQAITEGKATVILNRSRAGNWESLAQIYRAIIPLAKDAGAFAAQAYRQAIALDPINPNLRIALGGVYYTQRDFENAVKAFELATVAKPDLANAHYNYSIALRDANQIDRAISEMTLVLSLLTDKNSQDYQIAQKALEDMQSKKKSIPSGGNELTSPTQGAETPNIEPDVQLPAGSEPPTSPISPTPQP